MLSTAIAYFLYQVAPNKQSGQYIYSEIQLKSAIIKMYSFSHFAAARN